MSLDRGGVTTPSGRRGDLGGKASRERGLVPRQRRTRDSHIVSYYSSRHRGYSLREPPRSRTLLGGRVRTVKRLFSLGGLGLAIGLLGIIAPIAWDRYKSRAGIEVRETASVLLVEKTAALGKLRVEYESRPIDRVVQLSFVMSNTGRTTIRSNDIVSPPTIHLHDSDLLDARIERLSPPELSASIALAPTTNEVSLHFPLLNPGDTVYFTVLVGGSTPTWQADARIAGISRLITARDTPDTATARTPLTWTFYVVSAVTGVSALLFLASLTRLGKELAFRHLSDAGAIHVPLSGERTELTRFVSEILQPTKSSAEVAPAFKTLSSIPADRPLTEEERAAFAATVGSILRNTSSITAVALIFGFVSLTGGAYVAWRLW